jgi:hypothetical protein
VEIKKAIEKKFRVGDEVISFLFAGKMEQSRSSKLLKFQDDLFSLFFFFDLYWNFL